MSRDPLASNVREMTPNNSLFRGEVLNQSRSPNLYFTNYISSMSNLEKLARPSMRYQAARGGIVSGT